MKQIQIKINGNDIILDLYKKNGNNKLAILLPGLPYKPKKYNLMDQLNQLGFDAALLHYGSTWGSEGSFLKNIQLEVNTLIKKNKEDGLEGNKYDNVVVIGTSFGGGLALTIEDDSFLYKVIALSPVISYRKIPTISTLSDYLTSNFPKEYQFDQKDFELLINDQIINPKDQFKINPNKVILIGGEKDKEIHISDIKNFAENKKIEYCPFDCGHITFSKITNDMWEMIKNRLIS